MKPTRMLPNRLNLRINTKLLIRALKSIRVRPTQLLEHQYSMTDTQKLVFFETGQNER